VLPFSDSFAAWTVATAVPALIGLALLVSAARRAGTRVTGAFALGIFFWFFVDTIQGSSNLDVNFGFSGGIGQAAMVLIFILGATVFSLADRALFGSESVGSTLGSFVPMLCAIAVGIHGFGEGSAFGSTAFSTSSTDLLDAFGGVPAGVAYVLHKMLEPMMVGAVYAAGVSMSPRSIGGSLRDMLVLTFLFVLPSLLGAATGYFLSYDATYGFGLGTGTSIYVALRLGRQIFASEKSTPRMEAARIIGALALGFILIYVAALFHS
jgi:zinc transporter ZupT